MRRGAATGPGRARVRSVGGSVRVGVSVYVPMWHGGRERGRGRVRNDLPPTPQPIARFLPQAPGKQCTHKIRSFFVQFHPRPQGASVVQLVLVLGSWIRRLHPVARRREGVKKISGWPNRREVRSSAGCGSACWARPWVHLSIIATALNFEFSASC